MRMRAMHHFLCDLTGLHSGTPRSDILATAAAAPPPLTLFPVDKQIEFSGVALRYARAHAPTSEPPATQAARSAAAACAETLTNGALVNPAADDHAEDADASARENGCQRDAAEAGQVGGARMATSSACVLDAKTVLLAMPVETALLLAGASGFVVMLHVC